MDIYDEDTGSHKSLEEHVLENIDQAAKTAVQPATDALKTANFMKGVVIFLAFYTAFVAFACTYAIWQVQKQNNRLTNYLTNTCSEGNRTRAAEREVISTLTGGELELAKKEGYVPTKDELDLINRLDAAADTAWPQRDCSTVDDGKVVEISPTAPSLPKG